MIVATPPYALNIADEFVRQGLDPAACSLRIGCFGAEPWGEGMRSEIQTRLGIDAMDLYGLSGSSVPVLPANASRPRMAR